MKSYPLPVNFQCLHEATRSLDYYYRFTVRLPQRTSQLLIFFEVITRCFKALQCYCRYQVCAFCYQRLQLENNRQCPGCRTVYGAVPQDIPGKDVRALSTSARTSSPTSTSGDIPNMLHVQTKAVAQTWVHGSVTGVSHLTGYDVHFVARSRRRFIKIKQGTLFLI